MASTEQIACFENGLLWRLVDGEKWGFYNDTEDYEMHVSWKFGQGSKMTPLGDTTTQPASGGWTEMQLVIYPGETKEFVRGQPNGWKSSFSATPLSDEYREQKAKEAQAIIDQEIEAVYRALGHRDLGRTTPEALIQICVENRVPYVDLWFPPTSDSLHRPFEQRLTRLPWQRPTQYLQDELRDRIKLFEDGITADDVDQGQLGDCWFMCSVASLTEIPGKIQDIFIHPDPNVNVGLWEQFVGAYRVTINKGGWWFVTIIDNYFPMLGNRPAFGRTVETANELWVSLIEKAYAKMHGSYSSLLGGDALHALRDLTGYPTMSYDQYWKEASEDPGKKAALFDRIQRQDQLGYFINVNTPGTDNSDYMGGGAGVNNAADFTELYKTLGLGMGHAYSVMSARKCEGHRLLKIRNPWGNSTEWTGAWSDASPLWQQHPSVANACEFAGGKDDGTFWMDFDDVLKYFDGGGVCFVHKDWYDYRVKGQFFNGAASCALEITATKKVRAFVSLSQKDRRGLEPNDADASYEAIMLSLCEPQANRANRWSVTKNSSLNVEEPTNEYTFNMNRDMSMYIELEPNARPYYLVPRIFEKRASTKDYVVGMIADTAAGNGYQVRFVKLTEDNKVFQNYPSFDVAGHSEVSCEYQFNPEIGAPQTKSGNMIAA
jgi:hypothetical protein